MTKMVYNTTLQRGASFQRNFVSRRKVAQSSTSNLVGLGSLSFTIEAGVSLAVGQVVRAYSISDPNNWVEGTVTAYSSTMLVVNVTSISGDTDLPVTDWQILGAEDLTGTTLSAKMLLSPKSCAGRRRPPVTLTAVLGSTPAAGYFSISLLPSETTTLTLGVYDYYVLMTYSNTIDKREMLSGTIMVEDLGE